MCIAPSFVWNTRGPTPERIPVPCRQCWQCRANRVSDYVGRALCEAAYSSATMLLTLTYAPRDDLAEKVLTPVHAQKFIRALRDSHHKFRYIIVGEYGERKGRAHFHALLFFKGPSIDMPLKTMCDIPQWPHGHVMGELIYSEKAMRYVCHYVQKSDKVASWFSLSKKPVLGSEFFEAKAQQAAAMGLFPAGFHYLPPGGEPGREYLMTGAAKRFYINRVVELNALRVRENRSTWNEWVREAVEKFETQARKAIADKRTIPDWQLLEMVERKNLEKAQARAILFALHFERRLKQQEAEQREREYQIWLRTLENVSDGLR